MQRKSAILSALIYKVRRSIWLLGSLLFFYWQPGYSEDVSPLRVGITHFLPPYVIEGAHHELSGFDVLIIQQICHIIKRRCQFVPMNLAEIIPAVAAHKVDVGMGALTITLERFRWVNFSVPYLLSEARFLGKKNLTTQKFDTEFLQKKSIGVDEGSLYRQQLEQMHLNATIVNFKDDNSIIAALNDDKIDLALVDNPTAIYWQNHSANQLATLGKPFTVGLGLGIAISRDDIALTQLINKAILQYQKTPAFKQLYRIYFGGL